VDEHEFELINIIGTQLAPNQRDLSRQMDLSLGMTNMLIHRLLTKGYIRVRALPRKCKSPSSTP
jgi:DNA-binding MarR family transcriptional regulator